MGGRRAVVSGASIAGLSAAFWLRRLGWQVTVIERASEFRDGGQNVDVRGVAREVLHRMGLFEAVKRQNTTETGTVFVDADGEVTAELPSGGPDGATAELEVLRGDLARTIHDHLPPGVAFLYDDVIETVGDHGRGVDIVTSRGRELGCELLVIAEGVRSATRDRVFAEDVITRNDLDVTMVFGTIPRTADDDDRWRWHTTTRGRQIHLRPDRYGTTRAILSFSPGDDLTGLDREDALARVRDRYADAGWEAPRIVEAFGTSDDVYIDQLTQIRMTTWHRGRVVVAGDAGWCVTPMGGGGASLALTSGYVLAAELASRPEDTEAALRAYEKWMRPLVEDVQKLPPGMKKFAYPQTRTGLALRHLADKVLTAPPLKPLTAKLTQVASAPHDLPDLPSGGN
ncbi:FAD-dependent monooxygenase [Streptomyces sp. NPDC049916]|uniref:FAD-dependent monooxygenase n=1 Tax=Streptomyces sp. NPDC049916 TaxID=3155156 RepID=UPI003427BD87